MYGRKISTVLGSAVVLLVTAAFTFQTRAPFSGSGVNGAEVAGSSGVFYKVDGSLNALSKQVRSRMPASQKVQMLRSTLASIKEARKANPLATVDKEIYMDYSVESLEHVALDRSFSLKKCGEYKARIMNDFEPYAEFKPSHPALLRSYRIIEGLCS
ncbi:MAG: hypothetical protein HUU57_16160 [Bdellovibrio sp.]|nr:hypothetical protein [Bdellovibrio sp.]